MNRRFALVLAALTSISMACQASAQEGDEGNSPAAEGSAGARVDKGRGGFQLVTHGIWQAAPVSQVILHAVLPLPVAQPRKAKAEGARRPASSFRRELYLPHVHAAEAQYQLPPGLLDALIWTESRYNPFAVSGAGAAGLGQLMPKTAQDLGVTNRFDPRANLWAAARYLRQMLDRFGKVHLAVAAYNAGPKAVMRAGGIPLNNETPLYVQEVMTFWKLREFNGRD